jgi:hypothetical protein
MTNQINGITPIEQHELDLRLSRLRGLGGDSLWPDPRGGASFTSDEPDRRSRLAPDGLPLVAGGQGRSAEDVEADAWGSMCLVAYCAMCAIGLIVVGAILGVLA